MADTRVTQAPILVGVEGATGVRATQVNILTLALNAAGGIRATQNPVLVATTGVPGARVTQAPVLILARFVPCLTHWAQCWKITRTDGTVFRFTTLDQNLTFGNETYVPCDGIEASASESAADLGSVDNIQMRGIISSDQITEFDLYAGLFDGATVEVWVVPWLNANGQVPWRLAKGTTGTLSQGDTGFSMEVLGPGAKLQQQPLLSTYAATCRYDLGDSRCTVDIGALTVSSTVTSVPSTSASVVTSNRVFTDSARSEANGYFDQGLVTWTSGDNSGVTSEVKSYDSVAKTITLWDTMPSPIAAGDGYDIYPGCDKSKTTCQDKFSNFINFGGFPDIPGADFIARTPDSK